MVSLQPSSKSSTSTKSKPASSRSSSSTDHRNQQQQQPVPSSPTKKIKLSHLPDFSNQSTQMLLKNGKNNLPDSIAVTKKRLKPKKRPPTTTPGARKTPAKKARSRWLFSFLLQVLVCYLGLAYFYFCPKDPSSNPVVCRNLAEVHWALEPHISPYLDQLNNQFRYPLQKRVDRKLRPVYEHYLLPTWSHVQPQLSATLRLSKQLVRQSGLLEQAHTLQSTYWTPLMDHINQRYEQKLQPHIRYTIEQSKQVYNTLRNSRLIGALKTYLPHLRAFLLHNLIQPVRHTVLPALIDLYRHHLHPLLARLALKTYNYLLVDDSNLLKDQLANLKRTYRHRLLRPIKKLSQIYVTPQIAKIALKLNEYRARKADSPGGMSPNDQHHQKSPPVASHVPDPIDKSAPSDPPLHSDNDHHLAATPAAPSSEEPTDTSGPPVSPEDDDHHAPSPTPEDTSPSEPVIGTQKEWPAPLATEPDLVDKALASQDELADEEEDLEQSCPEDSAPQPEDHDDPIPEAEAQVVEEPLVETENLSVDIDEFMNEIDEEIASEASDPKASASATDEADGEPKSRYTPEEIAQERQRLETIAADGFARIWAMEAAQTAELVAAISAKRDASNLAKHAEIVGKQRTAGLEVERTKVVERLRRWLERAQTLETVPPAETASKAQLIIGKSKHKFFDKLVAPHLAELDGFSAAQYQLESEILERVWEPIATFASDFESEFGFGLTWLADSSPRDWTVYNKIKKDLDQIKTQMQALINGTWVPPTAAAEAEEKKGRDWMSEVRVPQFFADLARAKAKVEDVYQAFATDLDRLLGAFLEKVSPPSTAGQDDEEAELDAAGGEESAPASAGEEEEGSTADEQVDDGSPRDEL
ncbi:hypothetical protein PtA15_14A280 [Puccinia triticina]|uniref:Uncharacterized protein n=1 Tax=Puccinia triticina TaxID=208348 RepID=A0ABY7D1W0_9BASI|nr:uncharacterized protein PtA15_14A280 [Puccinia triticina]WAQ91396.1 hypothetical protein PtA15_14A280 [Puccinia triticina]